MKWGKPSPTLLPRGEGSQKSCSLSFWERARVRVKSVLHSSIQQSRKCCSNCLSLKKMCDFEKSHFGKEQKRNTEHDRRSRMKIIAIPNKANLSCVG